MSNSNLLTLYEEGLRTLLDLCEQCFGPNGTPVFANSQNHERIIPTKSSFDILTTINIFSENPLVKIITNFALEHNKEYGDHTLYMLILALNLYLTLRRENLCCQALLEKLSNIGSFIENQMKTQSTFYRLFENDVDFLVQLSMSIVKPKLFGYSLEKLESFCRFVVSGLLQSFPDPENPERLIWFEPIVMTLATISIDPYKYGEIFEGIIFPITIKGKLKKTLQRVIDLRSFLAYELIYIERRKLNAILMVYDPVKICDDVYEQMKIDDNIPDMKRTVFEAFEDEFIKVLEKSNVGLVIVRNKTSDTFQSKLCERSIFLLDEVDENIIFRISETFNVEIVTTLKLEDANSFIFQIEIPKLRDHQNQHFLAIPKPGIVTMIFYKFLDSNSKINEQLSHLLFKHIKKLMLDNPQNWSKSICHGAGCTEFILAGLILRMEDNDGVSSNFWILKPNNKYNTTQLAVSQSLIRIWELTRDPLNDSPLCKNLGDIVMFCQNNVGCVCGNLRQIVDLKDHDVLDCTFIKTAAIKTALRFQDINFNAIDMLNSALSAGALSGFVVRLVTQPLDVIKIRFQLQVEPINNLSKESYYKNIFQAFRRMYIEEGILGLWKGHIPAQYMSILFGAIQFQIFEALYIKTRLEKTSLNNFLFGGIAGSVASFCCQPIDILKTRLAAQGVHKKYSGSINATIVIAKEEGLYGFFRGLVPSLIMILPQTGIQFYVYHKCKKTLSNINIRPYNDEGRSVFVDRFLTYLSKDHINQLVSGLMAGVIAKVSVYPFDLSKRRLQVQGFEEARKHFGKLHRSFRFLHSIRKTIAEEGYYGLYKGVTPTSIKSGLVSSLTFFFYELFRKHL